MVKIVATLTGILIIFGITDIGVRAGECPSPISMDRNCHERSDCSSDQDCVGAQMCCEYRCGAKKCREPRYPGQDHNHGQGQGMGRDPDHRQDSTDNPNHKNTAGPSVKLGVGIIFLGIGMLSMGFGFEQGYLKS